MEILFATSNKHKLAEVNEIGKPYGVKFKRVEVVYPEIRSESVSDVAREGVSHVFGEINKPVIVEDSGLFIKAFGGFPGPYSRFVYDKVGCLGILRLMGGIEDRSARFISAVGYADENEVKVFEGKIDGKITDEMRGEAGFGYDPIFMPLNHDTTFAEDPKNKNEVSHRRKAFDLFCRFVTGR